MFIYCEDCNCIYREYHQVAQRCDTMYVDYALYEYIENSYKRNKNLVNGETTIVNTYKIKDSNYLIDEIYVCGDFEPSNDIQCKKSSKHSVYVIEYNPNDHSKEDIDKLLSLFTGPVFKWHYVEKHAIRLDNKSVDELFEVKRLLGINKFA